MYFVSVCTQQLYTWLGLLRSRSEANRLGGGGTIGSEEGKKKINGRRGEKGIIALPEGRASLPLFLFLLLSPLSESLCLSRSSSYSPFFSPLTFFFLSLFSDYFAFYSRSISTPPIRLPTQSIEQSLSLSFSRLSAPFYCYKILFIRFS